jgi:hypothetical protein
LRPITSSGLALALLPLPLPLARGLDVDAALVVRGPWLPAFGLVAVLGVERATGCEALSTLEHNGGKAILHFSAPAPLRASVTDPHCGTETYRSGAREGILCKGVVTISRTCGLGRCLVECVVGTHELYPAGFLCGCVDTLLPLRRVSFRGIVRRWSKQRKL